ncbi:ionotropic receptor 75a-like [Phlebotomus argentipes]|uniref:ionotropic receptor 75a-like n=1 Tax=Phlebotomus argentipes TaxID=94469 RepID=UPI002892AC67|nr:ionotropic receptor 75a-like [Phlebotomus argentipes]
MLCSERDFISLGKQLNSENIYTRGYFIGKENLNITSILSRLIYSSCGVVVNCECSGADEIVQIASNYRFFNITYSWLLFGAEDNTWQQFLDPVFNIEFSSDVVFVQTQNNSTKLDLIDVYSLGRHRGSSLIGVKFAEYDNADRSLDIILNLWPKFDRNHRANFKGFQLKAVVTIDRDNMTEADVKPLLLQPGKTPGIVAFVKYQSHLNYYLQDMYNFSLKYRITRAWAGHLPSGYRLGLLGVMTRGEADISMSAVFAYIHRFIEYDFVHSSYMFKVGFVFRVGSDSSASDASLLAPFETDVWLSLMVTICIVLFVGVIVRMIFLVTKHPFSGSMVRDLVDIFAALCQQGVDPVPGNIVQKIIIFMTLFLAFFLYNYYTSSVVGVLLSSPIKGPTTPEEILESTFKVSFDDVGYHKILFQEKRMPIISEIYNKKMTGLKRGTNDLPMYTGIQKAVPYIKSGGWAFHCELTEAYSAIAKSFDASEICDLRVVTGLMITEYLQTILPKFSQYKELHMIGFMRLHELGFVNRALKIYWNDKPECTSGITVFAVGFQAVSAAFYVLFLGMVGSLVLLVGEIVWKRHGWKYIHYLQSKTVHFRVQFRGNGNS